MNTLVRFGLHTFASAVTAGSLCGIALANGVSPSSSGDAIVQGFVQYQAKRVESATLDLFVQDLMDEDLLRKFLPETSNAVKVYDGISGQRLLPTVREFFKSDVETIKRVSKEVSHIVEAMRGVPEGGDIPPNVLAALALLKKFVKEDTPKRTTKELLEDMQALSALQARENATQIRDICATPEKYQREESRRIQSSADGDQSALAGIEKCPEKDLPKADTAAAPPGSKTFNLAQSRLDANILAAKLRLNGQYKPTLNALAGLLNEITEYKKTNSAAGIEKIPYTMMVHWLFRIIKIVGANEVAEFHGFQSSLLFLAQVVDAGEDNDPDGVESAIKAFVDEDEAYRAKRLRTDSVKCLVPFMCHNSIFVGSSFGVAAANMDEDGDGSDSVEFRSYGPVGIELKLFSIRGMPVSLTYAPIDVGAYITQELKGEDYSAEFSDVVAPSVSLSLSLPRRPVTFIFGYQQDIKVSDVRETDAVFFSIAYDLPILRLY